MVETGNRQSSSPSSRRTNSCGGASAPLRRPGVQIHAGGISSSPASRQVHVGGISSSPSSRRTNSCGRRSEGFLLPPYPGKAFQFIPDEGPFSPAEEIRLFFIVSPVNCGKVDAGNDRGELVEQLAEQKYDLQPRLFLSGSSHLTRQRTEIPAGSSRPLLSGMVIS